MFTAMRLVGGILLLLLACPFHTIAHKVHQHHVHHR